VVDRRLGPASRVLSGRSPMASRRASCRPRTGRATVEASTSLDGAKPLALTVFDPRPAARILWITRRPCPLPSSSRSPTPLGGVTSGPTGGHPICVSMLVANDYKGLREHVAIMLHRRDQADLRPGDARPGEPLAQAWERGKRGPALQWGLNWWPSSVGWPANKPSRRYVDIDRAT
jgi:hypothetical protein